MKLPGKTVERLSEYRRTLLECLNEKRNFIFSHDLAARLHITAVQVQTRPDADRLFKRSEKRI